MKRATNSRDGKQHQRRQEALFREAEAFRCFILSSLNEGGEFEKIKNQQFF